MSARFAIAGTPIAGVQEIRRLRLEDHRGYFERVFCAEELSAAGWPGAVAQANRTFTRRAGAVRGLHFQLPPSADAKLVTCVRGAVFDVAVDLRAGSATFLKWHGAVLSADNGLSMLIPIGCAHGMQTLTPDVELIYLHSAPYEPAAEGGVHPLDAAIGVGWPEAVTEMSERDAGHPMLTGDFRGIAV